MEVCFGKKEKRVEDVFFEVAKYVSENENLSFSVNSKSTQEPDGSLHFNVDLSPMMEKMVLALSPSIVGALQFLEERIGTLEEKINQLSKESQ